MAFNRQLLADKLLQLSDEMAKLLEPGAEDLIKKNDHLLSLLKNIEECMVDIRDGNVLTQDEKKLIFVQEYINAFKSAWNDVSLNNPKLFLTLLHTQQLFAMRLRKNAMASPDIYSHDQTLKIFFDPTQYAIFKSYVLKTMKGFQYYSDLGRIQNESKIEASEDFNKKYKRLHDVAIVNDYMDISDEDESVFVLKLKQDCAKNKYSCGLFSYLDKRVVFQQYILPSIKSALDSQDKKIDPKISPGFLINLAKTVTKESAKMIVEKDAIFTYSELTYMGNDVKQDAAENQALRARIIKKFNPSLVRAINSTTVDGNAMDVLLRTYGTAVLMGNLSYSIIQPIVGGFLEGATDQVVAGRPGRAMGNKWSVWLFNTIMQTQVLAFKSFLSEFRNFQQLLQKTTNTNTPKEYIDLLEWINKGVVCIFRSSVVDLTVNTKPICLLMQVALDIHNYKNDKNIYAQGVRLLGFYKNIDLIKLDSKEIDILIENVKQFDSYIKSLQESKVSKLPIFKNPKPSLKLASEDIVKKRWIYAAKLFVGRALVVTTLIALTMVIAVALISMVAGLTVGSYGTFIPLFVTVMGTIGHFIVGSKIAVSISAVLSSVLGFIGCKQEANEKLRRDITQPRHVEDKPQPFVERTTTLQASSKNVDIAQQPVFTGKMWKSPGNFESKVELPSFEANSPK